MADCSDPAISEAYEDVRSDKSDTTWLQLGFESERSNKLVLLATGSKVEGDAFDELKEKLNDDAANFFYVRVKYYNDVESFREKFILITWIGSNVKVMRRARISVQKADVAHTLRHYSIEVPASSAEEINYQAVVTRLQKSGGAQYGPGK